MEEIGVRVILTWGPNEMPLQFPDQQTVTVRQALLSLRSTQPNVVASWCDRQGHLRKSLQAFVNDSHVRFHDGLDTVLKDGDRLRVIPLVTGG
jgi:molybdopterin converting factor small subunit